jgi:hypothetical protein
MLRDFFTFSTSEQCQPFINIARHFQLISEMSENDLKTLGHSIGFSPTLDNPKSAKYQSAFATTSAGSGNGYNNNRIFAAGSGNGYNNNRIFVIKLNYLFESLNKIGLVKRLDAQLRLWVNTGTVNISVAGADTTNLAYNLTPANNTFSNTCPILVNHHHRSLLTL